MDKIKFSGKIIILEKENKFDFDGKQLKIQLYDREEAESLLYSKDKNGALCFCGGNPIPSEYISGVVLPENKRIVFKIQTENYGITNVILLNGLTDIYINVYRYMIIEDTHSKSKETTLSYQSLYFHHFLGLIPNYNMIIDKNNNAIANVEVCKEIIQKQKSKFSINNNEYVISPNYSYTCGVGKFVFMPQLTLKTRNNLSIDEIWKMYDVFCRVIRFLFLRNNIYPDKFIIQNTKATYTIYEREWEYEIEEDENLNRPNVFHSVRWARVYKNIGNIFNYFYSNKGDNILSSLYDSKKERYLYSKKLISSDAATFEHIFDEMYPNFTVHSEKGNEKFEEVKVELENLLKNSSGKKRKIYKKVIKGLNHVQLKDKLLFSLNEYHSAFQKYNSIGRKNTSNEEIADVCAKYRNDIDHGNDGVIIDKIACEKLVYMRLLIVVLYYSVFGINKEQISEILCDLFAQ